MVLAPRGVLTICTISNFPCDVSPATASTPSLQLANIWCPSNLVASTPAPMGRSARTFPSVVLMTISFCGLRHPMKRRPFDGSIDIPTGAPPGATRPVCNYLPCFHVYHRDLVLVFQID